jgi:sortase B
MERAKIIRIVLLVIFTGGFIYSLASYILYHNEARNAEAKIDALRKELAGSEAEPQPDLFAFRPEALPTDRDGETGGGADGETSGERDGETGGPGKEAEPAERLFEVRPRFRYLYSLNNDIVGWIRIAGTRIDYPVMQNKDDDLFYDRVNFEGVRDEIGLPYLDGRCEIAPKNQIQIIFGHNIRRRGLIFHDLNLYDDREFWEENQIIRYNTIHEDGFYQIFAAIKYDVRNVKKADFQFHRYTHFSTAKGFDNTEHNFEAWKEEIHERALYDTGIDFAIGDQYLILSTCENSTTNNFRFVILAKQVYVP